MHRPHKRAAVGPDMDALHRMRVLLRLARDQEACPEEVRLLRLLRNILPGSGPVLFQSTQPRLTDARRLPHAFIGEDIGGISQRLESRGPGNRRDPSGRPGEQGCEAHPCVRRCPDMVHPCLSDGDRSRLLYINSENTWSVQWKRMIYRINCSEPYVFIEKEVTVGCRQRSTHDLQRIHWTTYPS